MTNYTAIYVRKMGLRIHKNKLTHLEYYLKVLDAQMKLNLEKKFQVLSLEVLD